MPTLSVDPSILSLISTESITTVEDAVVELVTNSIDAYLKSKHVNKVVRITGDPVTNQLIVSDDGPGLSKDEINNYILFFGHSSLDDSSRGVFGRGSKDIVVITKYTDYKSINNGKLNIVRMFPNFTYEILVDDQPTEEESGFHVTMNLNDVNIIDSYLYKSLQQNVYLRNLYIEDNFDIIYNTQKLTYTHPERELVMTFDFPIENYEQYNAKLSLYLLKEPAENPDSESEIQFAGICFHGQSVYEVGGLCPRQLGYDYDYRWHKYARYLQLEISTDAISDLIRKYRLDGPSTLNPVPCLESNRRKGLNRKHPMVISLLKHPYDVFGLGVNLIRDRLDTNVQIEGETKDIWNNIINQVNLNIPLEEQTFAWRSRDDQNVFDSLVGRVGDIEINDDMIDMAFTLENHIKNTSALEGKPPLFFENTGRKEFEIKLVLNEDSSEAYEIIYFTDKNLIKINCLDKSIRPFITIKQSEGSEPIINLDDPRSSISIMNVIRGALVDILTRNKLLRSPKLNITTDHFNTLKSIQRDINTILSPYLGNGFGALKSLSDSIIFTNTHI